MILGKQINATTMRGSIKLISLKFFVIIASVKMIRDVQRNKQH